MLDIGTQVRHGSSYGRVIATDSVPIRDASLDYLVEWESGKRSSHTESELESVDAEEWNDSLRGLSDADRCRSNNAVLEMRCQLRKGHRTVLHRSLAMKWDDHYTGVSWL